MLYFQQKTHSVRPPASAIVSHTESFKKLDLAESVSRSFDSSYRSHLSVSSKLMSANEVGLPNKLRVADMLPMRTSLGISKVVSLLQIYAYYTP